MLPMPRAQSAHAANIHLPKGVNTSQNNWDTTWTKKNLNTFSIPFQRVVTGICSETTIYKLQLRNTLLNAIL